MSRASCALPSAWGSSPPEPDPPAPHPRHGACSLLPEQRVSPVSRKESAADFAATRHMIPSVEGFTGAVEPVDPAQRLDREVAARVLATLSAEETADDQLAALLERSFHAALLDALSQMPEKPGQTPVASPSKVPAVIAQVSSSRVDGPARQNRQGAQAAAASVPAAEQVLIRDAPSRAAVDPRCLGALRRAENGGPGREFGVLSVPAPTYEDQVRLAAASIRRNVERFVKRPGEWPSTPPRDGTRRSSSASSRIAMRRWERPTIRPD
jgi:hypothetical protein